ncbi:MAG TPA: hypothetical protein VHC22_22715 [Pirellulales bacterium]|nr:hypothetical protein [Pirellulales bacterium]
MDEQARDRAFIEVDMQRQRLEEALLEQLQKVLKDRDSTYLGRTHTVLQAISATRADNTVGELVEAVEFTLEPSTFPVGGRLATSAFYPVADTLRTLGSRRVIMGILSATAEEDREDKILRIYAWVLIEILGKDVARLAVERGAIARVPREGKRVLRLLKMVDEEPLLEMPPRKVEKAPVKPGA